ncbi:type 1 glutamine amidotransferase domain-containing protein [Xanthomonas axonopodis pv. ricini]|uniref:type 1 glutamine amidotransferase domain-containing protein n=1 Tax=Xanthomonas euvesicatoria TaxID=456327 RepID=UPI002457F533|nr:type 1 glutamine amidotransferase domain-containing protein [Xanthomonas euvesicatoria]MDH4910129.1 type 1 glutamine amidotransferase domain-containing protein [Xanthomonas euvesicatoria]
MSTTINILVILTSQATMATTRARPACGSRNCPRRTTPSSTQARRWTSPPSPAAEGKNPPSVERFLKDKAAMATLEGSFKIDNVTPEGYSAVFLPGGHGTMWDLPKSTKLAELLSSAWAEGKVVSAVRHGPAGLVNVKDTNGQPLVAGRRVAAFTDSEEAAAGLTDKVPFLLETRIRGLGAKYESGPDFQPFAVRDGKLVTGQNPASSEKVAELVLEAVREAP